MTISLKLPREMGLKLKAVAAQKRIPQSKYIRDLLGDALKKEKTGPTLYDLMKDGIGCFDSGLKDLATNPKHMKGFGKWRS